MDKNEIRMHGMTLSSIDNNYSYAVTVNII